MSTPVTSVTVNQTAPFLSVTVSGMSQLPDEIGAVQAELDQTQVDVSALSASLTITNSNLAALEEAFDDFVAEPGPQGPQGEPGPQGPQGPQGEPGEVTTAELNSLRLINSVYDLKEAGCKRTTDTDGWLAATGEANAAVMQTAFNRLRQSSGYGGGTFPDGWGSLAHHSIIHLPGGQWALAGTGTPLVDTTGGTINALVHTPAGIYGGTFRGTGAARVTRIAPSDTGGSNSAGGGHSALVYIGSNPSQKTCLIGYDSASGVELSNLCFHGRPFLNDTAHANVVGWAMTRSQNIVGSAAHLLHNLVFSKCGIGILLGVEPPAEGNVTGGNNDESVFDHIEFSACPIAVQMNAYNVLGHTFKSIIWGSSVDIAFDIAAGGTIKIDKGFIGSQLEAFIKFRPPTNLPNNASIGSAGGFLMVRDVHQHQIAGSRRTKFLDMSAHSTQQNVLHATFDGLDIKQTDYASYPAAFDLLGRVRLRLTNCRAIQTGMFNLRPQGDADYYRPLVYVDNSYIQEVFGLRACIRSTSTGYGTTDPKYGFFGHNNQASVGGFGGYLSLPDEAQVVSRAIEAVPQLTAVTVASGLGPVVIPASLDGARIVRAFANVATAGSGSGNTVVQVQRQRGVDTVNVLTTAATITTTARNSGITAVVNSSNQELQTDDILTANVTSVASGAPLGLRVVLELYLPQFS